MAPRRIQKQMLSSSQYTHLGFGHDVVFEQLLSISLAAGQQMGARCLTCCIMMGLSGHSPCSGAETAFLGAKFPVAERSAEIWGGVPWVFKCRQPSRQTGTWPAGNRPPELQGAAMWGHVRKSGVLRQYSKLSIRVSFFPWVRDRLHTAILPFLYRNPLFKPISLQLDGTFCLSESSVVLPTEQSCYVSDLYTCSKQSPVVPTSPDTSRCSLAERCPRLWNFLACDCNIWHSWTDKSKSRPTWVLGHTREAVQMGHGSVYLQ